MSKKSDLIKKIVKTNVGEKPTFGTDPRDPWSTKANITETALLNRYLKSRGINPEFASKDQKVAHSKTNQFKTWMRNHLNDPVTEAITTEPSPAQKHLKVLKKSLHKHQEIRVPDGEKQLHSEAVDKKDTITFDIPLLIRVLEFAREDLKSDINLHKMVERLISIRGKGTLTMNQYGQIVKEEVEALDEISKQTLTGYVHSAISDRNKIDDRRMALNTKQATQMRKQGSISLRRHKNITNLLAKSDKRSAGIDKALNRLTKEDTSGGDEILARHAHHHAEMMKAMKSGDKAAQEHHATQLNKAKMDYASHSAKVQANKPESAIAKDYKDQEKIRGIGHVRDHVEVDGETVSENRVVDTVKKAWKSVSNFDDPSPKYDGQTRRRQALKQKLATDKKKVSEAKEGNYGGDYQASVLAVKAKAEKKPVDMKSLAARMQASYRRDNEKGQQGKPVKEGLEPMAACNCPSDGANTPDDTVPAKKSTASKVKKLLLGGKKSTVQEELYDTEKEDKSTAPVGKKVKLQKPGVDAVTKETPQAAAVLTGGKTMTGEPRDTIEIDPMMKMRKQAGMQPEPVKPKKSV